jgi:hypothetical protein
MAFEGVDTLFLDLVAELQLTAMHDVTPAT